MWFKSLRVFRLHSPFTLSAEALHEALSARPARPCGSLELFTLGWERPFGRQGDSFTHAAGGCILVCARREERVLPAAVVRDELEYRIEEIEEREGRTLKRKEKAELKERVFGELLPRAFTRSILIRGYLDPEGGWLVVDAANAKRAETLVDLLRETLGSFQVRPLAVQQAPAPIMTSWLEGAGPGAGWVVGDECELRDPLEEGTVVRCKGMDLGSEEVANHLKAGKQVARLALEWQERLGFLLDQDLGVKRLRFLDLVQDEVAEVETDDAAARLDADFAIMSAEIGRFLPELAGLFGGMEAEGSKT